MDAVEMLRSQFLFAHRLLNQVLADVGEEAMRANPQGTVNPIASIWAHIVMTEDVLVNARLLERPTVAVSGGWSAKTGMPNPDQPRQPEDGAAWVAGMDISAFRDYAKAVYAATDEGLANAPASVLEREMDMGPMGKSPALQLLSGIGLYHVGEHTGEIAALKGGAAVLASGALAAHRSDFIFRAGGPPHPRPFSPCRGEGSAAYGGNVQRHAEQRPSAFSSHSKRG